MAKQQTPQPCGDLCGVYAAPRTHPQQTNIIQHTQRGENRFLHKKRAPNQTQKGECNVVLEPSCGG